MGTITAQSIIDDVSVQLFDVNNVKWARTELLAWLNQAQRQLVTMQPSANYVRANVQFTAGTVQTLPAGGWMLLGIGMTQGDDGATPGHAMRLVSKTVTEAFDVDYPVAAQVEEPREWWFDPQEPDTWYVNPPADGAGYVTITYSKLPTVITSEATAIDVSDVYEPALMNYIMYKACSKKSVFAEGESTPSVYWQLFVEQSAMKLRSEVTNNPNLNILPRTPDVQGVDS